MTEPATRPASPKFINPIASQLRIYLTDRDESVSMPQIKENKAWLVHTMLVIVLVLLRMATREQLATFARENYATYL